MSYGLGLSEERLGEAMTALALREGHTGRLPPVPDYNRANGSAGGRAPKNKIKVSLDDMPTQFTARTVADKYGISVSLAHVKVRAWRDDGLIRLHEKLPLPNAKKGAMTQSIFRKVKNEKGT